MAPATTVTDGCDGPATPRLSVNFIELPFEDNYADASDITLVTSDQQELQAHRLVLSLWSKVFNDMFVDIDIESRRVRLDDTADDMRLLLRSLYPVSDAEEVTSANVYKLLALADKYNIPMLIRKCEKHLLADVMPKLAALGPPATKTYGQPLDDVDAQGGAMKWLVLAQRYSMRTFGLALAQALGKNCRKWYVQRNPCLKLITDPELLRTMMCNIDLS